MDHVDEVVARGEHVTPGCEILLESIGRLHAKVHLRLETRDRLRRIRCQFHRHILRVFG